MFLLPKTQQTEVTRDGEDFILGTASGTLPYFEKTFVGYSFGHVAIAVWVAKQWGFLSEDGSTLGPNVSFELYTQDITATWPRVLESSGDTSENVKEWWGPAYAYGEGVDPLINRELWKVSGGWMKLSRSVKWRFTRLMHSYEQLVGTLARDLMVYNDLVDTSIVGNQRHQLLRKVRMKRTGEGRATMEPYHRQWQPIRRTHLDVIEVELGLPAGLLSHLLPGQTIAMIGIRKTGSS